MALHLFHILLCFLTVTLVTCHAALSPEIYWKSQLPNTEMPQSIRDSLYQGHNYVGAKVVPDVSFAIYHHKDDSDYTQTQNYVGAKVVPDANSDFGIYNHKDDSDTQIHNHPNLARFFLEKDLRKGNTMTLHFTKRTNPAPFFPRKIADTIPFSSNNFPEILDRFSVKPGSTEAGVIKKKINECEETAMKGEEKYCATSLENMIDYAKSKLGKLSVLEVISTEVSKETKVQNYKIEGVMNVVSGERSNGYAICHKMSYPYAVFYCHNMKVKDDTKAFVVPLKGEADGTQVKAVAICHTDTSQWDPKYSAFKLLGVKPGTVPICHFLPQDHLVWYNNNN